MKKDFSGWDKDFAEFLNIEGQEPPSHVTQRIMEIVHKDFNPSAWHVISRLAMIQAVVGGFSLLICAQFGIGPGPLMHVFMQLGETLCMALCGALFLGLSALSATLLLEAPEVRLIRNSGYLPLFIMGVLSLGIFFGFGAEIVSSLAFVWLLGGFIGGLLAIELGWKLRRQLNLA